MELKDYTKEQLRAELKRRWLIEQEEKKKELRCRNCVHCKQNERFKYFYECMARTYGKKIVRNYTVKPSTKACDKFESKYKEE